MTKSSLRSVFLLLSGFALTVGLTGCSTVLAVADVAASTVVKVVGVAADATIETARIGTKVVGKTAEMIIDAVPSKSGGN